MDKLPPFDDRLTQALLRTAGAIYWFNINERDEIEVVPTMFEANAFAWESNHTDEDGNVLFGVVDENGNDIGTAKKNWPDIGV